MAFLTPPSTHGSLPTTLRPFLPQLATLLLLSSAAGTTGCECGEASDAIDVPEDLTWLVGTWHTEGEGNRQVVEETWQRGSEGTLLGVSHPVIQGLPMVNQEQKLRIERQPDGEVVFVVLPPNQPETVYRLESASQEGGRLVFRRRGEGSGPVEVRYERIGPEHLRLTFRSEAGGEGAAPAEQQVQLHRGPAARGGERASGGHD